MTKMQISKLLLCCLFIVSVNRLSAQENQAHQPLRLFLIGNSFSQNASRYLPEISRRGGHELVIGRAEIGGCPLQRHWDSVAVNLQDSTRGKAYNGKSLRDLLSKGTWDVVTIQQASVFSGNIETYSPYARNLYNFIKQLQPNAIVVFHQTWAYRADAKGFSRISGGQFAKDQQEMWQYSRAAYHTMADSLGIGIIPVGDAFWQVASSNKWGFRRDTSFDYKNPVYAQLPLEQHSLNVGYRWDNARNLAFDPNHANDAGCYLAALVWYGFLFNESPAAVSFKPPTVADDFAVYLREVAVDVLKEKKAKKH
jgi:hypothetical protein